ncbi:Kelch-like protein 33 [Bagarius yarrelli]|uniref:Kelch-like protein 33 n=1 Tax=Bagarius yarrelli TaxID=175774 RepID=A0A556V7Z7_BAGYA|nr:Kelch-like protein 33 [Bagarius yarrelli]
MWECGMREESSSYDEATGESSLKCNECGKNRAIMARYSEGYGTEEECVQSDPQRESDADADIEDADTRLHVVGSLQRISSKKRKRQRVTRQDTTESEDDGGQSHRNHRWSLRLSPHRSPSRTILEESVSQVRPLVICHCNPADTLATSDNHPDKGKCSEEYEEDPEKLYCHPTFPNKVFQALEEMKRLSFLTDLTLKTQSEVHFNAHSLALAAISSLILEMLQQANESNKTNIYLCVGPEVSEIGLSAVLEFAYTGSISDLNRGSLAQIQMAAQCLGVPRILKLCKEEEERDRMDNIKKKKTEDETSQLSPEEQMKVSLQSIRELWEARVGCDVEVEVEGRIFSAHRVILSASSDYFYAMFSSGMRETQQNLVSLQLLGAPELEALLHCCYSGDLFLDWGCIFELTSTALQFQFQPALSLCLDFMQHEIDAFRCLDVAAFAEAYEMSDLQEMAEDFMLRHFEDVAATVKFQDLPVEKLKRYLCSNCLCVTSELSVFRAVVSWIEADPRTRMREARVLMRTVLFPLMTFTEFREVRVIMSWPQVSNSDLYKSLFEEFCTNTFNSHSEFRIYLPKETLVLVGGERITENLDKRLPCRELWFSNSFRNHVGLMKRIEWRKLGDLPETPRFGQGVRVIGSQLYVVGGRHYYGKDDTMKSTYRYDPIRNSWQRLTDMNEKRANFALVVLNEKIFAMGGDKDSDSNTESVEVYCPITDTWSFVHPLDQSLSGHAASVWNEKIFISGGFDSSYRCLASMLLYHPENGSTYYANMTLNRAQHCMETLNHCLYVAGGVSYAGAQLFDQLACEFFDPVNGYWCAILPMSLPHVCAASAVLEGKIYIIGGYCQEDFSDTKVVHRFDPAMQHWENLCGTPGSNSSIAACVLALPDHLRQ